MAGFVARYAVSREFESDGRSFDSIDAVDVKGARVLACENEVEVTVSGTLVVLDNGSPPDHTPFASSRRCLCRGSLFAIAKDGNVKVTLKKQVAQSRGVTENVRNGDGSAVPCYGQRIKTTLSPLARMGASF